MRCRDIDRLSSAYVDGELDDGRASALRGHLHQCERCRERVTAEAAIRDACDELEPVDPPSYLWSNIEHGLARAEMADAERSRIWLWWQTARQHMLPAAVACAAVVLVVVWMSRRGEQPLDGVAGVSDVIELGKPQVTSQAPPLLKTAVADPDKRTMPTQTFTESRIDEIDRADARYVAVINELKKTIAKTRTSWSPAVSKRFDTRLAMLEKRADAQRTQVGPPETDPAKRDALYAVYQQQIDLLQSASFGEVPR